MDTPTTTPDTPSDASIEAALFAQARDLDAGKSVDTPAAPDPQPRTAPEPTQRSNAPAAPPSTPPPSEPAPEQKPPAAAPPETPYQQKRSEQQRNADAWKKLEATRAEFQAEREKFYREQAAQARAPQQSAPAAEASPLARYSAEQLENAASEFDRQGKFDLAESARQEARARREQPAAAPQQQQATPPPAQDPAHAAALAEWKANLAAAEREHPELSQPDTPLRREVAETLAAYPHLRSYPQGITHAVELVRTIREAKAAAGLRTEVAALKDRLTKAESRLAPASGSPESGLRPRTLGDMTDADAERELLRMAAAQDASG
jgi:hypothetical protein